MTREREVWFRWRLFWLVPCHRKGWLALACAVVAFAGLVVTMDVLVPSLPESARGLTAAGVFTAGFCACAGWLLLLLRHTTTSDRR